DQLSDLFLGGQVREIRQGYVQTHPFLLGGVLDDNLVFHIVSSPEDSILAKIHKFDIEAGGIPGPDIDVDVGHARNVDGAGHGLNSHRAKGTVFLDIVPFNGNLLQGGIGPIGPPSVHLNIGIGPTEKGNDL